MGDHHGADSTGRRSFSCVQNLVWFLWNDGEFLIFSEPKQAKVANIRRNSGVSLNLDSIGGGGVVVFTGSAGLFDKATLPTSVIDRYLQKYADGIKSIGLEDGRFLNTYSEGIRFTPDKVRGF